MKLFSLTSSLHSEIIVETAREPFVREIEEQLGERFDCRGDFAEYSTADSIIYVRTGGSEGIFKSIFCKDGRLDIPGGGPVRLLASGQSNSLAASMEILSYLRLKGFKGEILHGSAEEIAAGINRADRRNEESLICRLNAKGLLEGRRYGVIGKPSDWLISSDVDYARAKENLGCELVDIDIEELVSLVRKGGYAIPDGIKPVNVPKFGKPISAGSFQRAWDIYGALRQMVDKYRLDGLTIRCFDLLTSVENTGCLALAQLNSEGIIATCEGDVPAMVTMAAARQLSGKSSFQVNLSRAGEELLFAHCTVPFDMVRNYSYDTHFESGIGVGIHGEFEEGIPATIMKIGADMEHCFVRPVTILRNQYENNLCRTQIWVKGADVREYMLREPLGNHHVIVLDSVEACRIAGTSLN